MDTVKTEPEPDIDTYLSSDKNLLPEVGKEVFLVLPSVEIKTESEEDLWTKKEIKTEVTVEEHSLNLEDLTEPDLEALESPEDNSVVRSSASNADSSRKEDIAAVTGAKRPKTSHSSTFNQIFGKDFNNVNTDGSVPMEKKSSSACAYSVPVQQTNKKLKTMTPEDKLIEEATSLLQIIRNRQRNRSSNDSISTFCQYIECELRAIKNPALLLRESIEPTVKKELESCEDVNKPGSRENMMLHSFNFSEEEKVVFNRLFNKYVAVLEDKRTDAVTLEKKKEVWDTLSNDFCALFQTSKESTAPVIKEEEPELCEDVNKSGSCENSTLCSSELSEDETVVFNKLIFKYITVIEDQNTDIDIVTNQKKAWEALTNEFNSCFQNTKRTPSQLQSHWEYRKHKLKNKIKCVRERASVRNEPLQPSLEDSAIVQSHTSVSNSENKEGLESNQVPVDLILPPEELQESSTSEYPSVKVEPYQILLDLVLPVKEELPEPSASEQSSSTLDSDQVLMDLILPVREVSETSDTNQPKTNLDSDQVSVPLKELVETSTNEKFNLSTNLHNARKEPVLTPQNNSRKRKFANETILSLQNKHQRLKQTCKKNIEFARKKLQAELKEIELKRQLQQLQFTHKKEMYRLQLESIKLNTELMRQRYEMRLQELKFEERKYRALFTTKNSE